MPLSFTSIIGCCWERDAYIYCQLTGKSLFHKTVLNLYPSVWFFWWIYPLVDSRINSLQHGHVFRHKFLEKGIITAALLWWRWWLPQQQTEAHTIRSKGLFSPNIYVRCYNSFVSFTSLWLKKGKNKTSGFLDSAAECWQLPLFVGKGIGLYLCTKSWVFGGEANNVVLEIFLTHPLSCVKKDLSWDDMFWLIQFDWLLQLVPDIEVKNV